MSLTTSGPKPEREDDELVCEFLGISRAQFHAPIERLIFVSIDGMVHMLGRTMYGLQDVGAAFDRMSGSAAKKQGCKLGTFTHCVLTFGNLVVQCFGDDGPVLGTRREVLVEALPATVARRLGAEAVNRRHLVESATWDASFAGGT